MNPAIRTSHKIFYPIVCAALIAMLSACSPTEEEPLPQTHQDLIRATSQGLVAGFKAANSHQWLGIPFAAPPTGELRWRAPRPAPEWQGTLKAVSFADSCKQIGGPLGGSPSEYYGKPFGSEDCLYLNIYTPTDSSSTELPVMLWIHGGGNIAGSAASYDFSRLAQEEKVIVVSSNYRLGVFGWLDHPHLADSASSELDRSTNYGILDLIAALQWVQHNIETFGGNPEQVTIFGESAGGRNVLALLTSPHAKGLFSGAISQSGSTYSFTSAQAQGTDDDPIPNLINARMLIEKLQHMHPAEPATSDNAQTQVAWMQSLSADDILKALIQLRDPDQEFFIWPAITQDGIVIPAEGIRSALLQGQHPDIPLLLGTTRDETRLFAAFDPKLVSNWGFQYFIRDPSYYDRLNSYSSRVWKETGSDQIAAAYKNPAWVYRFDWDELPTILWTDFQQLFGAGHAFDIPFVSGSLSLSEGIDQILFNDENKAQARALSDAMMAYWAEFAYSGTPGTAQGRLPEWKAYSISKSYMVFDTPADGGLRMERDLEHADGLLSALATDAAIADAQQRCAILAVVLSRLHANRQVARTQYSSWQNELCTNYSAEF
ncbi:MAG: carboxylesterase/lipase family protein [Gammaproteobacteria bacterium]